MRITSRGTCKGNGLTCIPETSSVTSSTPASSAFRRVALAISQPVDRVPSAGRRSPAEGVAGTNATTSAQAARATTRAKLCRTGCITSCSACSYRHACVFATRPFNLCLCFVPTHALMRRVGLQASPQRSLQFCWNKDHFFCGTPGAMSEAEATKLVREAEQAEAKKNVFFQPRPDWEKAADCYQKAALILRSPALKKTDAAVCAFDKASVAHAKCGAKFFAGVALENAANVLRDARCLSAAAAKYAQASEMFLLGDNIEKGSEALIKAAKVSAEEQPDFAIQYYLDVIAIFEESDKHVYISDTWRSALGLMLRRGRLEDAAKLLQRMFPTFARLEQADYLYKAQLRCQSCVLSAHLSVLLPPANYPRACPLCKVDATPPCSPLFPSKSRRGASGASGRRCSQTGIGQIRGFSGFC